MNYIDYLKYLRDEIHTTVLATVDQEGNPITCVIDMMLYDQEGLYFITAKGKSLYTRLKNNQNISLSGVIGEDTLSSESITLIGKAREIGSDLLDRVFIDNPYMNDIYPSEESRKALTVFHIYEARGEYFDLTKRPIFRESFTHGGARESKIGYYINSNCTGCKSCIDVCPQSSIKLFEGKAEINNAHCLHCGRCVEVCKFSAVERR